MAELDKKKLEEEKPEKERQLADEEAKDLPANADEGHISWLKT